MISHPKPQTVKILKRKTATEPQTFLKISIIFMPIKNIITFLYRVSFPGRGCPKYIVYCTRSRSDYFLGACLSLFNFFL